MAHNHDVYDMENHFEINGSSRFIKETSVTKLVVVQGDHKSEVLTFKMPRYIDGHDMTLCNKIRIHYINLDTKTNNKSADVYEVTDLTPCEECEDVLTFTWTIEAPATKYSGTLSFLVKFECTEGENVLYQWNTAKYVSVNVLAGIDNSEEFVEKYSNVLEEWYNELTKGADSIEELNQQAIAEIELAKEDAKEDIQGKADATMAEMEQCSTNTYNSFKNNVDAKAKQTLASIPEDYSDLDETVKELSAYLVEKIVSKNLYNPSNNIENTKAQDKTDGISSGMICSEWIKVEPNETYCISINRTESSTIAFRLATNILDQWGNEYENQVIQLGSDNYFVFNNTNATAIRISAYGSSYNKFLNDIQVELGDVETSYERYFEPYLKLNEETFAKFEYIDDLIRGKTLVTKHTRNMYDKSTVSVGILDSSGNVDTTNTEFVTTDFIEVVCGQSVRMYNFLNGKAGGGSNAFCWYDSNKNLIQNDNTNMQNIMRCVDVSCAYVRISIPHYNKDNFVVLIGDVTDDFDDYIEYGTYEVFENPIVKKKIVADGDSITYGTSMGASNYPAYDGMTQGYSYIHKVAHNLNCDLINLAIPMSTLTYFEGYEVGLEPLVIRYNKIPHDADLVYIAIGSNDWSANIVELGNYGDTEYTTFYGALDYLCKKLKSEYPTTMFMFGTIIKRGDINTTTFDPRYGYQNSEGKYIKDYNNAIKEVCEYYGYPVHDMYAKSGVNAWLSGDVSTLIPDAIHPNHIGHDLMAQSCENAIKGYV